MNELTFPQYLQYVNEKSSTSLHSYLISLGMSSPLNFYTSTDLQSGGEESLAINSDEMVALIEEYLFPTRDNVTGYFNRSQISIHTRFVEDRYTEAQVRSEMINQITNGNPVLYFAFKQISSVESADDRLISGKFGHAMVAYDYDSENDLTYVHLGRPYDNRPSSEGFFDTIESEDNEYVVCGGIMWLEINEANLPHVCSDNYKAANGYVCGCQFYDCDK